MKKILVALSGGVDSAVSAMLLKQAGYDVSAAYMKTWMNEEGDEVFANCPWQEDIDFATAVAKHLEIDFEVVNLIKDYRERVVNYMVDGYKRGITPNPDIMCNREMKFGVFLDYALKKGFDGIATGHYCRRRENPDGTYDILEGVDKNKDQSYFLALVNQEQLSRALFPVGELEKPKVRELALKQGLPNAGRKDSQGICFLGKVDIGKFLKKFIPDNPGKIVNLEGKIIGEHAGLHRFTLGQRKGMGVPSNTDFERYVVVGKDFEKNELILAFEGPDTPNLYTTEVNIRNFSWVNREITEESHLLAKPRYRDPSQAIVFTPHTDKNGLDQVRFEERQRALAPGQMLALYDGEVLLGGGFYC